MLYLYLVKCAKYLFYSRTVRHVCTPRELYKTSNSYNGKFYKNYKIYCTRCKFYVVRNIFTQVHEYKY